MNKFLLLLKVQFQNSFSGFREGIGASRRGLRSLALLLLPLAAFFPLILTIQMIHKGFAALGMPELTLTYAAAGTPLLILVLTIPLVISSFFFSQDLPFLSSLPVSGRTILLSKLSSVYLYALGIAALFQGSALFFYLREGGALVWPLLAGLAGILLAPMAPMVLGVVLTLPFMALAARGKNRNTLVVVGNILLIVLLLGVQILLSRSLSDPEALASLLAQKDGLLKLIGGSWPPAIWLTRMIQGELPQTLYFLLTQLGILALLLPISGRLYRGALLSYNQEGEGGGKGPLGFRQGKAMTSLVKRQLGILFGNPTFLLNGVLTLFVPLLLLVMYSLMGIFSLETLKMPLLAPFRPYIFAGIVLSPAIMGSLSAVSISREGRSIWETRVLPVSALDNLKSRLLMTHLLNIGAQLLMGIPLALYLPLEPLDLLSALFLLLTGNLLMARGDLIINIFRPYLTWTNPTAAVKNNMNVLLSLASRALLLLPGYGLYRFFPDMEAGLLLLLLGSLWGLLWLGTIPLFRGPLARRFQNMDIPS